MIINENTKIAKLVNINYHILPILGRFGQCTGFGEMNIKQFCQKYSVSIDLFLELVRAFLDKNYYPNEQKLQKIKLKDLIDYLQRTHKDYIDTLLHLESLLSQIINQSCKNNCKEVALIVDFFKEYKTELLKHIEYEDNVVYPYILALEEAYEAGKTPQINFEYDIENYLQQHINVEEKIIDIKTLILKYLTINANTTQCYHLLFELYDFEADLIDHQSIEERILLPRAKQIEQILKAQSL